jgi:hypothetical protein
MDGSKGIHHWFVGFVEFVGFIEFVGFVGFVGEEMKAFEDIGAPLGKLEVIENRVKHHIANVGDERRLKG